VLLDGAIAQLGERVLCKHEVVGSIPSGSTRPAVVSTRSETYPDCSSKPKFRCSTKCYSGLYRHREEEIHPIAKATFIAAASISVVSVA
jgi:hypothetical protein